MDTFEAGRTVEQIEDYLIPFLKLDAYERSLYYHLFRHTRLIGKPSTLFVISSARETVGLTEWAARNRLRNMNKKGCIKIDEIRRDGISISVLLPNEIIGCMEENKKASAVDIEKIDFYADPKYREAILYRENEGCFYCLRKIAKQNYVLDHLIAQVNQGDNSYRNVVAACHECNSLKQGKNAEGFVRELYRKGVLTQEELTDRMAAIELVKNGSRKPPVSDSSGHVY
ncbi:MAG: HNH endonuclease signature motif containing protein [Candidatus Bathyarchaeota archaeon]